MDFTTPLETYEEFWQKYVTYTLRSNGGSRIAAGGLEYITNYPDPLIFNTLLCLGSAFGCWLLSLLPVGREKKRNYSYIDRIWSITPIIYSAYYCYYITITSEILGTYLGEKKLIDGITVYGGRYIDLSWINLVYASILKYYRLWTVSFLVMIWGLRLTYNFYRRGGYSLSEQDYRWSIIQNKVNNALFWELFNFFFTSLFQSILLLAITFPVYLVYQLEVLNIITSFPPIDHVFYGLLLSCILFETVSDQQVWNFHKLKSSAHSKHHKSTDKSLRYTSLGFNCSGLFRLSRHPNYFAEQSFWVLILLYPLTILFCSQIGVHQDILIYFSPGVLVLLLLFHFSTRLTESISSSKYPYYSLYQKTTNRFLPMPTKSLFYYITEKQKCH